MVVRWSDGALDFVAVLVGVLRFDGDFIIVKGNDRASLRMKGFLLWIG